MVISTSWKPAIPFWTLKDNSKNCKISVKEWTSKSVSKSKPIFWEALCKETKPLWQKMDFPSHLKVSTAIWLASSQSSKKTSQKSVTQYKTQIIKTAKPFKPYPIPKTQSEWRRDKPKAKWCSLRFRREANLCQKSKIVPALRPKQFLKRQQLLLKPNITYRTRKSARKEKSRKISQL